MRLTHVLTAVNENPDYAEYAPLWAAQWRRLEPEVTPVVICAGEEAHRYLQQLNVEAELVAWRVPPGMSTQFAAQCVRLFAPAVVETTGGVMIDDVDEIPLCAQWFSRALAPVDDWCFAQFRGRWHTDSRGRIEQLNMMTCTATPTVWGEIMEVGGRSKAEGRLAELWAGTEHAEGAWVSGWMTDQLHLTARVRRWAERTRGLYVPSVEQTGFQGLCLGPRHSTTNRGREKEVERAAMKRLEEVEDEIARGVWTTFDAARPARALAHVNRRCAQAARGAKTRAREGVGGR